MQDEEAALLAELERIKKERAEEARKKVWRSAISGPQICKTEATCSAADLEQPCC